MRIGICDDKEIWRDQIKNYCRTYFADRTEEIEIAQFSSSEDFVENNIDCDLLFLDIEMGTMSGLELGKYLDEKKQKTYISYVSSYEHYMEEAYDTNVIGFLRKPITESQIWKILAKVEKRNQKEGIVLINENKRIKVSDILYMEAQNGYTYLYLRDGTYLIERKTIAKWEKEDTLKNFCRIHHSYFVNLEHIKSYTKTVVVMEDKTLEISRRKFKDFEKKYHEYCIRMVE